MATLHFSSVYLFVSYLYSLLIGPVQLLLDFLLQEAGGLSLFDSSCCGLKATVVAGWITLIQLWTQLFIHSNHYHTWRRDVRYRDVNMKIGTKTEAVS